MCSHTPAAAQTCARQRRIEARKGQTGAGGYWVARSALSRSARLAGGELFFREKRERRCLYASGVEVSRCFVAVGWCSGRFGRWKIFCVGVVDGKKEIVC